ncbi:uncharacterized protein [Bemisia tabaci]|uniref:uncharacterized protein n=1 Tax=Bemisia tabaci TaxID=7038 RepID=UPI003B28B7C4
MSDGDNKLFVSFRSKSKYRKVARSIQNAPSEILPSTSTTPQVPQFSPTQAVNPDPEIFDNTFFVSSPPSISPSPLDHIPSAPRVSPSDGDINQEILPGHLDTGLPESEPSFSTEELLELVNAPPEADYSEEEDEFIDICDPVESLQDELRKWVAEFNITLVALSALLCILRSHGCFSRLPKDARTVLKTPKSVIPKSVPPGQYYHLGLREILLKLLESVVVRGLVCIKLIIGIDGLPLFKSAAREVWPILACISNVPSLASTVFPIGLYVGAKKPLDCGTFLADFVEEAKDLIVNGLWVKGVHLAVQIKGFSLDAPAKAFVLNIKGHAGYWSCTRCHQEGEHFANRVTFPNLSSTPRTSAEFLRGEDTDFHHGPTPLSTLGVLGFDLVRGVALDYLHLVCLGVVRTLLFIWLYGKVPLKLSAQCVQKLSDKLVLYGSFKPYEFARRHRSLDYAKRFKGTEFRQLLLYSGPVLFEEHLSKEHYNHFLCLHVAMTILLHPTLKNKYRDYAKDLLKHFVQCTIILYGQEFLTHNFHGLLHIADDLDYFNSLDECSAFKFENYLGWLKKLVRKGQSVLQQLIKRLKERCFVTGEESQTTSSKLLHQHDYGPLPATCCDPQYRFFSLPSFKLSTEKPNNCCGLKSGNILLIENFAHSSETNEPVLIGREFTKKENLYMDPCESSCLGIFEVSELSALKVYPVSEIAVKYYLLPSRKNHAVFPILHTQQ